jgi:hypothetical protein
VKRTRTFKRGFLVGAGVGYVFGTKAGRERYEQLRRQWKRVRYSDTFRGFEESLRKRMHSGRIAIPMPDGQRVYAPAGYEAEKMNLNAPLTGN